MPAIDGRGARIQCPRSLLLSSSATLRRLSPVRSRTVRLGRRCTGEGRLEHHPAGVDGSLDRADHQGRADEFHEFIAVSHGFLEIVASVDVDKREGHAGRPESLAGEPRHDDRILAAGKKQGRVFKLGRGFAEDENGFGFELVEMAEVIIGHGG